MVWSTGDVVVSTGAAFVNQGTLRLLEETEDDLPSRIRASQEGEQPGWRDAFSSGTLEAMLGGGGGSVDTVAIGGAGSAGGGAANWAWEELSYYDASL